MHGALTRTPCTQVQNYLGTNFLRLYVIRCAVRNLGIKMLVY